MTKKWFAGLLCLALLVFCRTAVQAVDVSAKAAVLIEQESGQILFGKNEEVRLPMASTTKIMTAIVALEHGNLEDVVTVSKEAAYTEGSSMYLHVGENIRLESLLYGLMLNSGNDAAVAIAEHVSGSVLEFVKLMNETAAKIGAKNTSFQNPNGLDGEAHETTAYDLALITRYGMENPVFRQIVQTKTKAVELDGTDKGRILSNHNKLLRLYPDCDGVKTGFTKKCGRCLVSSATRDGMQLIAVTLNAPDDWNDHIRMLNDGFSSYELLIWELPVQETEVENGKSLLLARQAQTQRLLIPKTEKHLYHAEIKWNSLLKAPILPSQQVGELLCLKGEEVVASIPLLAETLVEELVQQPTFFEILQRFFEVVI